MEENEFDGFDGVEETSFSEISIAELSAFCEEMFKLKRELDEIKETLKIKTWKLTGMQGRIIQVLDSVNSKEFSCPMGKVVVASRFSIKTPKTTEQKKLFFDYLKAQGHFEELISINSNTLNGYIGKEAQQKELEGVMDWEIPGLGVPQKTAKLQLWKKK